MSKPFMYWVRLALVATMCTLITFSPVSAGRWMDRLLHRDACNIPVDSCQTTGPAIWYAAPATSTTTCICVPEYVAPAVIDTGSSCCSTTQPDQVYPTQPTPAYMAPMEIAPPATREPISPAANQEVPAWTPPVVEHAPTLNAPAQSQPKVENPPATARSSRTRWVRHQRRRCRSRRCRGTRRCC